MMPYYQDVYDHVLRATEWTESLRDLVTTILETNLTIQSNRMNVITKQVTSWAAIIAVPTLVTGFYGMNVPYPASATSRACTLGRGHGRRSSCCGSCSGSGTGCRSIWETESRWSRGVRGGSRTRSRRDRGLPLTREMLMSAKVHHPITPGGILLTEFLEPLGISQYRLAQATGLPQTRISEIVHGRRRITPDTGLRLSRALGLSERYWIDVQTDYDIETEHDLHGEELRQVEVLVSPEAA